MGEGEAQREVDSSEKKEPEVCVGAADAGVRLKDNLCHLP